MVILGLKVIGQIEIAKTLAAKWVSRNYLVYKDSGQMYEKVRKRTLQRLLLRFQYNVAEECFKSKVQNGEYELQEGFGWTNGVVLDLLHTFASELSFDTQSGANVKCECCRPKLEQTQSIETSQYTADNSQPSFSTTVELSADQQNALTVAAALAAEFANNTPTAALSSSDCPSMIRTV